MQQDKERQTEKEWEKVNLAVIFLLYACSFVQCGFQSLNL